ncbi:MAG: NADH-plastoquinone oxidoreductase subunit [Syntrophorhabdus sp. PtaU1.Bin153]|nr:MAG: NADH-plastoquinone oxidoreductase subunit [Syntrophorhabdus sp. PtaU1.Bin153]
MERVVTGTFSAYDPKVLQEFLEKGFESIGLSLSHCKVLLKPNLVMGKSPQRAVNTHPDVVRAVAAALLDRSCDIYIGDSPGYESTEKALRGSGIMDVVEGMRLKVVPFDRLITKRQQSGVSPYRLFTFGQDPGAYDAIVNLPKLKTHGMMGLTLGVKNTFGFIHSLEKARWHLRAGQDRMLFASILIDIHRLVGPVVTILDGIIGMDREGPSNGRAREIGLIAMSRDAFALDHYVEGALGLATPLPITVKALEHGLIEEYDVCGHSAWSVADFEMPKSVDTDWALPSFVKSILRNLFVRKPRLDPEKCKSCGVCLKVCPTGSLVFFDRRPAFDYRRCIRCYCCQEMCPEGAIRT